MDDKEKIAALEKELADTLVAYKACRDRLEGELAGARSDWKESWERVQEQLAAAKQTIQTYESIGVLEAFRLVTEKLVADLAAANQRAERAEKASRGYWELAKNNKRWAEKAEAALAEERKQNEWCVAMGTAHAENADRDRIALAEERANARKWQSAAHAANARAEDERSRRGAAEKRAESLESQMKEERYNSLRAIELRAQAESSLAALRMECERMREALTWRPIESAPKGCPALEQPSEWFLARGKPGPKGFSIAVIRRCFGNGFGPWECTGDAYYKADFFTHWMPLPDDAALSTGQEPGEKKP